MIDSRIIDFMELWYHIETEFDKSHTFDFSKDTNTEDLTIDSLDKSNELVEFFQEVEDANFDIMYNDFIS